MHGLVELRGGGRRCRCLLALTHAVGATLYHLELSRHDLVGHIARSGHNVGSERRAIPNVSIVALVVDAAVGICAQCDATHSASLVRVYVYICRAIPHLPTTPLRLNGALRPLARRGLPYVRTAARDTRPQGRAAGLQHSSAGPVPTELPLPAILLGSPPRPGLTPAHAAAAWQGWRIRRRPLRRNRAGETFKQSSRRAGIATGVQVAQASIGACSQWMPFDLFDAKKHSASSILDWKRTENSSRQTKKESFTSGDGFVAAG